LPIVEVFGGQQHRSCPIYINLKIWLEFVVPVGNLAKPKFPKWAAKMGTMACTQCSPYHNDFHAFHPFCFGFGFGFSWASLDLAHHQVFLSGHQVFFSTSVQKVAHL